MSSAVVVGSGPNGLAGAVHLAMHGLDVRVLEAEPTIGGGCRSSVEDLPGLLVDECSAFHPFAAASPYLSGLGLEEHGLRWRQPDVQLVHPLDGGRAAALWRDEARTAAGLGPDGPAWDRLIGRASRSFGTLVEDILGPLIAVPRHPFALARFGLDAVLPATLSARRWRTDEARALFGGIAAHAFAPLDSPFTSSVAIVLAAAAHTVGWPVAEGGSGAITAALAARLARFGGSIETGRRVEDVRELDGADVVLLDLTPSAAARILGDRLPPGVAASYRRFHHGPAAYRVDFAVEGGIPWTSQLARRAGTVHVGGTGPKAPGGEKV